MPHPVNEEPHPLVIQAVGYRVARFRQSVEGLDRSNGGKLRCPACLVPWEDQALGSVDSLIEGGAIWRGQITNLPAIGLYKKFGFQPFKDYLVLMNRPTKSDPSL